MFDRGLQQGTHISLTSPDCLANSLVHVWLLAWTLWFMFGFTRRSKRAQTKTPLETIGETREQETCATSDIGPIRARAAGDLSEQGGVRHIRANKTPASRRVRFPGYIPIAKASELVLCLGVGP